MEPSSLDCQESPWYDILEMTKLQRWRMDWGLPRRGGRREVGMAAKEEWEGSFWWTFLYLDCGGCTGYTCGEITHTHTHTHTHTEKSTWRWGVLDKVDTWHQRQLPTQGSALRPCKMSPGGETGDGHRLSASLLTIAKRIYNSLKIKTSKNH